jgi:hypothetical protein
MEVALVAEVVVVVVAVSVSVVVMAVVSVVVGGFGGWWSPSGWTWHWKKSASPVPRAAMVRQKAAKAALTVRARVPSKARKRDEPADCLVGPAREGRGRAGGRVDRSGVVRGLRRKVDAVQKSISSPTTSHGISTFIILSCVCVVVEGATHSSRAPSEEKTMHTMSRLRRESATRGDKSKR